MTAATPIASPHAQNPVDAAAALANASAPASAEACPSSAVAEASTLPASVGEPALPAAVSVACVQAFIPTAIAGATIALVAPITFVRGLGVLALAASLLAIGLHAWLLQRDHPERWRHFTAAAAARIGALRTLAVSLPARAAALRQRIATSARRGLPSFAYNPWVPATARES